jgi:ParB/RepB/Spo0J family partition protein
VAKVTGIDSGKFDGRLEFIPVDSVKVPDDRLRKVVDSVALAELKESIRAHGVLVPITVADAGEHYELVCGYRRLLAVRELALAEVPAVIVEKSGAWRDWATLTENRVREPVNAVDEALWFKSRVESTSTSQHEVARNLGVSPEYLSQRLGVLKWPGEVRAALAEGLIGFAVAREIAAITDEQWRAQALKAAVFSGCTARQAAEWRRASLRESGAVLGPAVAGAVESGSSPQSLAQRVGVLAGVAASAAAYSLTSRARPKRNAGAGTSSIRMKHARCPQ